MPLHGSLETFALPDVLTLLASTAKSGELRVTNPVLDGVLLAAGKLVGSEVGGAVDHTDAVFKLLRLAGGTFTFTEGTPGTIGEPEAVAPVLVRAQARLETWLEIEAVVPSMQALVTLAPALPGAEVTIDADRWQALVAIAGGNAVTVVAQRMELGSFDASRLVKELVDAGLVNVLPAPVAGADSDDGLGGDGRDRDGLDGESLDGESLDGDGLDGGRPGDGVDALAAWAEQAGVDSSHASDPSVVSDPSGAHATSSMTVAAGAVAALAGPVGDGPDGDGIDEPINRGLLLKFLSSVRS